MTVSDSEGGKEELTFLRRSASSTNDFGLFLLEDENRQRVKAIPQDYMNKAEEINKEILEQWITGRGKYPVAWKTLTEVLHDIELNTLAGEIEAVKCMRKTMFNLESVIILFRETQPIC